MPNRRRRKLSTAMSAVAALAVTSPFAVLAISELTAPAAPQQHDFVQASVITDLPNELMSALSQGLSQFGINLPPLPTGLSPSGAQPISTGLGTGLTSPLSPGLGTGLTSPLSPGLGTAPALTPGLGTATATAPMTATDLANPALTPALGTPALTPAAPTAPGLSIPPAVSTPALTVPGSLPTTPGLGLPATATAPGLGLGLPSDGPISAPLGLDPAAGTYPILGDPSLGAPLTTGSTGSTGIIGELSSAAQQLGVGQVVDLLKGVVMPGITSAMQQAAPAAAAAVPAAAG